MRERKRGCDEYRLHHGSSDDLDRVPLYILHGERDYHGPSRMIKRRLEYYSLAWIKAGDCWYWNEKQRRTIPVKVGQVIAAGPSVVHAYGGHGRSYVEDFVVFFGPVADAFTMLGLFAPTHPFMAVHQPERIGEIADIIKEGSVDAHLRAGLVLEHLLVDARCDAHQAEAPYYPRIQELLKTIADAPAIHLSNRAMATSCGMSESHFRKVFRRQVGIAPSCYCERLRMQQAGKLLSDGQRRIQEVAAELGYDNPFYFSQRFRKVMGVSPRTYRQSLMAYDTEQAG